MRIKPVLIVLSIFASSCGEKIQYLDDDFPGLIPKKYAVGIVNIENRFQQNLTMSPEGNEHLITITDSALWRYERILRIRNLEGKISIDTPQFVIDFKYENQWFIGEPMISPDNQNLYFVADYPPDIWNAQRTNSGDWSLPTKMAKISTEKDDWYVSVSQNNNLYFTNGTLYQSTLENGTYKSIKEVGGYFKGKDTRDACISPNEDYMIFTATDSLSTNQSDLFISFNDGKGNWSEAQNLGGAINTQNREFAPYISPDEKFLFFSRRDQWQNAQFSNIYWVSLKIIDKFRDKEN